MNHACEPTLLPEEVVQLRGYFRIVFIARRHIYPGEELTFDYSAPCLTLAYIPWSHLVRDWQQLDGSFED